MQTQAAVAQFQHAPVIPGDGQIPIQDQRLIEGLERVPISAGKCLGQTKISPTRN